MRRYKAVIIDDEVWTRQVIRSLGEWDKYGIEIAGEASDGEYGMELVKQVNPDIIITDVCMPHRNGLELVERIREYNSRIQVIFMSGYDDFSYVKAAIKLEAVDYLLKPVKPEELNYQLSACTQKLSEQEERFQTAGLEADFLKEPWAGEYERIREEIREALNSLDINILNQKFDQMKVLLMSRRNNTNQKGNMISIYYTLIHMLQKFMTQRNYEPTRLFENKSTVFVFSQESTPEGMTEFLRELYLVAAEKIQELAKNRNKLDMRQIQKYAEQHYKEGVTLEATAAAFFVSKEYLSKAFKIETGKGFTEFITALRMEKAKELIVEYKVPIKEAGIMVGYVDQAHFYKTFKKYFGKTPGELKSV